MHRNFLLALVAVLSLLAPFAPGQSKSDSITKVSLCQLLAQPGKYEGTIQIRAQVRLEFENFSISGAGCRDRQSDDIWLQYGSGKAQPTGWCCGDPTLGDSPSLVQDQNFKRFHQVLTATRKASGCKEAALSRRSCFLYDVTATLTGRFDSADTQPCANGKGRCCPGGFGHLGFHCTRLIIQSVRDVEAVRVAVAVGGN